MNFKPFYVKNKDIDRDCIKLLYKLCLEGGARYFANFSNLEICEDVYIGVTESGVTEYFLNNYFFGESAVELSISEAINHVEGISTESVPDPEEVGGEVNSDCCVTDNISNYNLNINIETPTITTTDLSDAVDRIKWPVEDLNCFSISDEPITALYSSSRRRVSYSDGTEEYFFNGSGELDGLGSALIDMRKGNVDLQETYLIIKALMNK